LTWGPWQAPPGIDRDVLYGTAAIAWLGGAPGRARIVAQEVAVPQPEGARRLVEWVAVAGTIGLPVP
jgi:hypothetical protein